MKDRYEVSPAYDYDGKQNKHVGYVVVDNLTSKSVEFQSEHGFFFSMFNLESKAQEKCQQLNTEDHQKRKSEQIMKVAGIGGHGVNLYNEFNFSDLWEVVEWVAQQYGAEKPQINVNGYDFGINSLFASWFEKSGIWAMEQHEMQTAIVDKIHELMTKAGMIT